MMTMNTDQARLLSLSASERRRARLESEKATDLVAAINHHAMCVVDESLPVADRLQHYHDRKAAIRKQKRALALRDAHNKLADEYYESALAQGDIE